MSEQNGYVRKNFLLALFIVGFGAVGTLALYNSFAASTCTVDAKLVNSCRPWVGAEANGYPGIASDHKTQLLAHESRIGHQLDVVHFYSSPGDTLDTTQKYFINRSGTYLMLNWKPVKGGGPGNTWKDADGRNTTVNANIVKMANSIKSVAPKKIFLTVYHEPENDVSPGGSPSCGNTVTYKGNMGRVS